MSGDRDYMLMRAELCDAVKRVMPDYRSLQAALIHHVVTCFAVAEGLRLDREAHAEMCIQIGETLEERLREMALTRN